MKQIEKAESMKKISNLMKLCLLVMSFTLIGLCSQAQSLEDYLKEGTLNNLDVQAAYKEFEVALTKVAQARGIPDPSISFGYFISPIETRVGPQRAKLSLSQMFPWFGTLKAKEELSVVLAEAKYEEYLDIRNRLELKIKMAFYPIYEIKRQIHWKKENLKILETYKTLATSSFSNGKGSLSDVIRIDILIENTKTDIDILNEKFKPLKVNFNFLLNKPEDIKVLVPDSLELINMSYQRDSILINNPKIEAIEAKIKAAKLNESLAEKMGMPQLGFGMDYAIISKRSDVIIDNNGRNVFMPMISMSLPIFRKKYKAAIKEAELTGERFNYKKQSLEYSLKSDYEIAWFDLEKSRKLKLLFNSQIKKTKQVIDLLYSAYSNSGNDFEEVLRTEQELLKYRTAQATETRNFYIALAQLEYLNAKSE